MTAEQNVNNYLCEFIKNTGLYPPKEINTFNEYVFENYINNICRKVTTELNFNNYMGVRFAYYHNIDLRNKFVEYRIGNLIYNYHVYNIIAGWIRDEKIKNILFDEEC
jgi:hypothetical protein